MNKVWGKAFVLTGLILMLGGAPSWGAPPNNDASDAAGNTAGGTGALQNNSLVGGFNTADGFEALAGNAVGSNNTAAGAYALFRNSSGSNNTATGAAALYSNIQGDYNTASGAYALSSNTGGFNNTASGAYALSSNTGGSSNTASGGFALYSNFAGFNNTASGYQALYSNTTGIYNTASGFGALARNTQSSYNTAVGTYALVSNTLGNNNIAVGMGAGEGLTSGSDNIYLGNRGGTATESDTMRLGAVQTRTFIAGIIDAPVSGSAVFITNAGQLGIQASSRRYKRDIQPMGAHSRGLLQLHPVIFRYKHDAQGERQYGLIAEEVAHVYPELVTRGANGDVEAVRYHEVIPMLLNEVQHQQRQLATQAQELATLKAQNARLRAAVVQQQERDTDLAARLERLEAAAARAATQASR